MRDYVDRGYLPETKRILDCGFALRRMDASIPDVSSTSWTSFMTGVNPGEHGIYGFMELGPCVVGEEAVLKGEKSFVAKLF